MATAGSIPHFLKTFPFNCLMFESCFAWTNSTPCGQETQNILRAFKRAHKLGIWGPTLISKIALFPFIYCM